MKRLLAFFCILFGVLNLTAQVMILPKGRSKDEKIWKRPVTRALDVSKLRVDYNYTINFKNEKRNTVVLLQVGDSVSRSSTGYEWCIDSLYYCIKEERYSDRFADEEWNKFVYPEDRTKTNWIIYKNTPRKGQYFIIDSSSPGEDWKVLPQDIPEIKWELIPGPTRDIGGHECLQAKAKFWGREWTVWYAPDIPISLGPWMLGGLPGLILYASDESSEHVFDLAAIRKSNMPIIYTEQEYFTTKRYAQVINQKIRYCKNPIATFKAQGLLGDDVKPAKNELFYNPLPLFEK